LLCLGFDVSERSVSRYLRSLPRTPRANLTWTTFLRNHRDGIAAMDFFTVPTAMFRVLHVFLVIRHGRRDVLRCAVTTSPTAAWVAQQLRETFPFESAPRFMIFDRDTIFSAGLTATIRSMLMDRRAPAIKALGRMGSPRDLSGPSAGNFSTTSSS
jgi:putative transposase